VSILNLLSRQRHLDDTAIAGMVAMVGTSPSRFAAGREGGALPEEDFSGLDEPSLESIAHLKACAPCRARYDAFTDWLADARAEAIGEADDVFPAERLAIQQAQILRRLESLERPGRVIAFPRFAQSTATVRRGPQRWIAAAAAAGLIVGLGAGELLDFRRAMQRTTPSGHTVGTPIAPVSQTVRGPLQPGSVSSDDAFLYDDSDSASTSPSVEALQALDALTPRVRDLDQVR
jgi:hypothetical protein